MDASDERDDRISIIHVAACVNDFVLFIVHNILLYRQTVFCLSIQPLMDTWAVSIFCPLYSMRRAGPDRSVLPTSSGKGET